MIHGYFLIVGEATFAVGPLVACCLCGAKVGSLWLPDNSELLRLFIGGVRPVGAGMPNRFEHCVAFGPDIIDSPYT